MEEVYPMIFKQEYECNTYYVDDKVKLLIDAGVDFKKHVDILVITHIHPDHVVFAKKIQERTNCKIYISKEDNEFDMMIKHAPVWGGKNIEKFKVNKLIKEGDVINTGKYLFKVVEAPGHTKGCICLFEPKHKILFSGDVLFSNGNIGRTDFPHSVPSKMSKSLEKLDKLNFKLLLPGHGNIVG